MCACHYGIRVYLPDGNARYTDRNPNHPINR
jgi:anaerobic selenocysteine-containing dehydrogenase